MFSRQLKVAVLGINAFGNTAQEHQRKKSNITRRLKPGKENDHQEEEQIALGVDRINRAHANLREFVTFAICKVTQPSHTTQRKRVRGGHGSTLYKEALKPGNWRHTYASRPKPHVITGTTPKAPMVG